MNSFKLKAWFIFLLIIPLIEVMAEPSLESSTKNLQKTNTSEVLAGTKKTPKVNDSDSLSPDKVILNFENADMQSVIKAISKLSGKNFVVDPRVKGTVNIVSDQPISKIDSYKVLEAALRMQGFASVEADGVIKVLPEVDVKSYGMKTTDNINNDLKTSLGDQVITKVFVINHGSAMQLSNALRPLVGSNSSISVYTTSNAIVVTDYASNITRISKIINQLSTNSIAIQQAPVVIPLKHAVAADMAQTLQAYLQGGSGAIAGGGGYSNDGPTVTITVDAATNSLILNSVVKDKLDEIKSLAISLDKNVGDTNNNMHVVYMKNADASHVAEVLRAVANNQDNPDIAASSSLFKFVAEPTSTFSPNATGGGTSNTPKSSSSSRANSNTGNQKDQPRIVIQAEPTINAIIIVAPDSIYRNLRMVVEMLDIRRAQVMIEALIVSVDDQVTGTFGIQWVLGAGNNSVGGALASNYAGNGANLAGIAGAIGGAVSGDKTAAAAGLSSIPKEVLIGVYTGTVSIGGQTLPGLAALADALSSSTGINVIARPTLMTMDNEEARIMVGQNIPLPNGTYQNTGTNPGNLVTTVDRKDVGTSLKIKPLITQNGSVQLEVYEERSVVDNDGVSAQLTLQQGSTIAKSDLRLSVLADDGQIIAIGGLSTDNIKIIKNGIPVLSDIPYLGWLFSWQQRVYTKNNLILFLRPVIVRNQEGAKTLTNSRYKYVIDQQSVIKAEGNILLPTIKPITVESVTARYSVEVPPQPNNIPNLPILDKSSTLPPVIDMRMQAHPELKNSNTNEQNNTKNINSGNNAANLPNSGK